MVSNSKMLEPVINLLNPNLPFIASSAALELDEFANGRGQSAESINSISEMIRFSIDKSNGLINAREIDSPTLVALNRAVASSTQKSVMS